ncbi:hypothetical protein M378DRAFT_167882 [Amanita muscaria Koide BX008]|uniref:Uncharacterized protein n=1 Tax=Amanita muscaria (strain Koide BX008) TaxID=946122 RepID=A0A0C2WWC1_AMAMK|nr:hypothetical protein M378DRAFT_167882 [Amanita muscaria Koide BX008]
MQVPMRLGTRASTLSVGTPRWCHRHRQFPLLQGLRRHAFLRDVNAAVFMKTHEPEFLGEDDRVGSLDDLWEGKMFTKS